jgi:uncharacterized membrane protein YhaH (DUF805 family)
MNDIFNSVSICFDKFATFRGRAKRNEFWWFVFFITVMDHYFGLSSYITQSHLLSFNSIENLYTFILALTLLIPIFAAGSRRLNDIGKSGWWLLIILFPIINLLLIFWWAKPSVLIDDNLDSDATIIS